MEAAQCWRGAQYLGFDMDSSQLDHPAGEGRVQGNALG